MAKVNSFDVLKRMGEKDLDIRLATAENITNMQATKAGTKVTIGVPGNVISEIYSGKLNACFLLFDNEQFSQTKQELEREADSNG